MAKAKKFNQETLDDGNRIIGQALRYDFDRMGFYPAMHGALTYLEMEMPERGSELSRFFGWQHREYKKDARAWLRAQMDREGQAYTSRLRAEAKQAAREVEHALATSLDAITRIGDPEEREAFLASYEAARQDEEARLAALRADRAARPQCT